jgi:hypothetical protein
MTSKELLASVSPAALERTEPADHHHSPPTIALSQGDPRPPEEAPLPVPRPEVPRRQPPPVEPEHLTFAEAAEWLRCSSRTLQRLLETGTGPPVIRLSERRLIFRLTDLRKWLAGRTHGAAELSAPRRPGRPRKEGRAGPHRDISA